jgi:Holliday junction resolvase
MMANAAKAKGSRAERQVADFLIANGIETDRIPAGATLDRGDLWVSHRGFPTIDVKDHAQMQLAAWVDRSVEQAENARRSAGVVWHKRRGKADPGEWYVSMTGGSFLALGQQMEGM